ncbi:MAG TPA: MIT C-terminal domain-containing protein, partial [Mucilaginibacter sp.]
PAAGTEQAAEAAGAPARLQSAGYETAEGQFLIRDNQSGISYLALFGRYLAGAGSITVKDPFIRMGHQMRNFMELCAVVAHTKADDQEVNVHLVTNNVEEYLQDALQSFKEMADSLEESGIYLTYEFDSSLHDRSIVTDTGWKVVLGRGLDIFQKSRGRFDISEFDQEKRLCKACEITYLKVT